MGTVPVAPSSKRILLSGESSENGFNDKLRNRGLRTRDVMNIPMLRKMMFFRSCSGLKKPRVTRLVFHQDPGLDNPQCGQRGSSELISLRQFGQRIERLWSVMIIFPGKNFTSVYLSVLNASRYTLSLSPVRFNSLFAASTIF